MLTRSRGSFDEILEGSDLIVELIGGIEPAREYVLRAMRAGRHVVTANKQLLSQHGEELWDAAREHGVQLRFEGAVAGVVPVIRVLQESLAGRDDRPRPRDRQRHDQLHPHRDGADRDDVRRRRWPRPSGSATPRPTRPRTSTAATRPPRWRSSPGWRSTRRCTSTRSATRGSSTIQPDDLEYARELGLRAEADRHRRAGRRAGCRCACTRPSCTRPPAGLGQRAVQRGHGRVRGDHRDHDVGARRGRAADAPAPCSAT